MKFPTLYLWTVVGLTASSHTHPQQQEFLLENLKRDLKDLPSPSRCPDTNKAISLIDKKGFKLGIFCSKSFEKVIKTKIMLEERQGFFDTSLILKSDEFWHVNRQGEKEPLGISDYDTLWMEENSDLEGLGDLPAVVYRGGDKLEQRIKTMADLYYNRCGEGERFQLPQRGSLPEQRFEINVDNTVVHAKFQSDNFNVFLEDIVASRFLSIPRKMSVYYSLKDSIYRTKHGEVLSDWAIRQVKIPQEKHVNRSRFSLQPYQKVRGWLKGNTINNPKILFWSFKEVLGSISKKVLRLRFLRMYLDRGSKNRVSAVLNIRDKTYLKFSNIDSDTTCYGDKILIQVEGLFFLPHRENDIYTEKVYYDGVSLYKNTRCERDAFAHQLYVRAFDHKIEDAEVIAQYTDFGRFREFIGNMKPHCDKGSCVVQSFPFVVDGVQYEDRMRYHCIDDAFYVYQGVHVVKAQDAETGGLTMEHVTAPAIVYLAHHDEFAFESSLDDAIAVFLGFGKNRHLLARNA